MKLQWKVWSFACRNWSTLIPISTTFIFFVLYLNTLLSPNCQETNASTELITRRDTNNPNRNGMTKCYLFAMIISSTKGVARRNAIRETWLSRKIFGNIVVESRFIIGTKGLPLSALHTLQTEQEKYKDMLFLLEHQDSYEKLTLKVLKTFSWISRNIASKFVLKADDDSFVVLPKLLSGLKAKEGIGRLYWGFFRGDSNVKRRGQWAEPNWVLCDHYLPYAMGGGYVLSADLVNYIGNEAHMLQTYKSEDVSVGAWLAPLKLNRIHDVRFDTEFVSRGCNNSHVISHKQLPEEMYEKHDQLTHYDRLCKEEKTVMKAFEYRWDVPPSKCCRKGKLSIPT